MAIKTKEEYEAAKKTLREHFAECNCFLPMISCTLDIEQLREEAAEYYFASKENAIAAQGA